MNDYRYDYSGPLIFGVFIGMSISFLALWIAEWQTSKDDQWGVGFSKGWGSASEYYKLKESQEDTE